MQLPDWLVQSVDAQIVFLLAPTASTCKQSNQCRTMDLTSLRIRVEDSHEDESKADCEDDDDIKKNGGFIGIRWYKI